MSIREVESDITDVNKTFPTGKNVRIKIEGLAVCRFDRNELNPSFADFLQFVDMHELKFSVVKIDSNDNVSIIKNVSFIPRSVAAMSVKGSNAKTPDSYQHIPISGEYSLDKLLHLSRIHSVRFTPTSFLPITTLTMENTSFYSSEITPRKFKVKLGGVQHKSDNLCKVIGGYIECDGGTLDIDIPTVYTDKLDIADNRYEIAFTNHCEGTKPQCQRVIGSGGSDVRFLYHILQPEATPISLEPTISPKTSEVAACLPGQIEPFP